MPPPPVPFGISKVMGRSKSRSQMRGGDDEHDLEGLPMSPSMDDIRGGQGKKRGFWERMSGMPSKSGTGESRGAANNANISASDLLRSIDTRPNGAAAKKEFFGWYPYAI
jgi:hypothetical protein